MTPEQYSHWYATTFDKPLVTQHNNIDYSSDEFKIDLSFLSNEEKQSLVKYLQEYLSLVTYYSEGKEIKMDASNQELITSLFYFNALTIPNIELLKALYAIKTGETK